MFMQSWLSWHALLSSEHSSMSSSSRRHLTFRAAASVAVEGGLPAGRLTLTRPAVRRDGQASGTRAVVGAHDVVAGVRTRVPHLALVLICGSRNREEQI